MRGILFRDDQSLFGSNWYKLPKKLFVIPFILSFLGLFTIYSLIGSEYSINFLFKHFFYLIISFIILFSPGGESFDLYKDFIDRGIAFNNLIKDLRL